jgi:hypothetical protein
MPEPPPVTTAIRPAKSFTDAPRNRRQLPLSVGRPLIQFAFLARRFLPAFVDQLLHEIAFFRHITRYNGLRLLERPTPRVE